MHIAELVFPGTQLIHGDQDLGDRIRSLLDLSARWVAEASIALSDFEAARETWNRTLSHEWRRAFRQRQEQIRDDMRTRYASEAREINPLDLYWHSVAHLQMEQAEDGVPPDEYSQTKTTMAARNFVYAIHGAASALKALAGHPDPPGAVPIAYAQLIAAFPSATHLRDSSAHIDERVQRRARGGRPLQPVPFDNPGFSSPAAETLVIECLRGINFAGTTAAGDYAEVEVSVDSLRTLQRTVQQAIAAYNWTGPSIRRPF